MEKVRGKNGALFLIRIMIGVIFIAHGLQKTFGMFGGSGIEGFSENIAQIGFNPPLLWAWVAALSELIGGLFLIAGILPRISAFLIGVIMVVAIFRVHWQEGFFGIEYQLLILVNCCAIMLGGAGWAALYNKG